jgi:phosphatidylglycerophosphate synthase
MTHTDTLALALAAAVLLTMPIYAIVARGRPLDAEVARRPRTILLGYWVRDWAMWLISPLERGFVRAGVSPDAFNVLGAAFGLAAGVAYAARVPALAGWLILLGGAADIFDGRIARARGIASSYGAFIDSTLDRFAETVAFVGLAFAAAGAPPWHAFAIALALGASMLVSYTRARGEALGVECKGGVMQRAERLVLLALASLLDGVITSRAGWMPGTLLAGVVLVLGLGAFGTAVYRTVFIARALLHRNDTA